MSGRMIAVSDIHGCSKALAALLDIVALKPGDTLVVLGDIVDRGTDTRQVLDQLLALQAICRVVAIRGNHEEMLLAAQASTVELRAWIYSGGARTLDSYGFGGGLEMIPASHLAFLRASMPYYETERHVFVHANYVADLPMEKQSPKTLYWESLYARMPGPHFSGKTFFVGHTPQEGGQILDLGYMKCIETDCVGKGWLTAVDVDSGRVWQTDKAGRVRVYSPP